ncbi:MAG: hypothetical protein ACFFE8_17510 [Candidatus Heimdallarchaeota archaeon]
MYPRILNGSYHVKVIRLDTENASLMIYASYVSYDEYGTDDEPHGMRRVPSVIFNGTISKDADYEGLVNQELIEPRITSAETDWRSISVRSYEYLANYSVYGYCCFSAELDLKNTTIDWSQAYLQRAEIEFSYQGFHDPIFYQFLQDRNTRNVQFRHYTEILDSSITLLILFSPGLGFLALLALSKRGEK